jgi:leader peptidase (prepilin peptidase) / N-methyltransferase
METTSIFTILLATLLVAITLTDIGQMRIPDLLSALLFASATLYWLIADRERIVSQIATGAAAGSAMWFVRNIHTRLTGRFGLGLGDVKMVAGGAVWLSPFSLPFFIFVASFAGLVFALTRSSRLLRF